MTPANQPRARVEVTVADRSCWIRARLALTVTGKVELAEQIIAQHVAARVAEETARVSMLSATAACAEIPALSEYVTQVEKDLRIVTADRDGVKAINEQHRARIAELERAVKGYQQGLTTGLVAISETQLAASRERERGLRAQLLLERQKYVALVTHLEGPDGFTTKEPGTFIALLKVFTDGSGFVREYKRIEPGEEIYPCKEWREWHAGRERHVMPYKVEDVLPAALAAAPTEAKAHPDAARKAAP